MIIAAGCPSVSVGAVRHEKQSALLVRNPGPLLRTAGCEGFVHALGPPV
jgi:hypothetical protein